MTVLIGLVLLAVGALVGGLFGYQRGWEAARLKYDYDYQARRHAAFLARCDYEHRKAYEALGGGGEL
jgi:hypothetical protein